MQGFLTGVGPYPSARLEALGRIWHHAEVWRVANAKHWYLGFMQPNHLLYFLYGKKSIYRQEAQFSILSALRHQTHRESFSITVLTDQPQALAGWPVRVVALDEATLADWMGTAGYVHRRKACAIRLGLELARKSIFVDTDTIFLRDPAALFERVSDDQCVMDQFEFLWREASKRKDYTGLVSQLAASGGTPPASLRLYNSGICGMTAQGLAQMDQAIGLIDQWAHLHTQLHTLEQIAVSFVLADKQVAEARDCVHHYYSQKDYHHAMLKLFFQTHGEHFSQALVEASGEVPSHIPPLGLVDRVANKCKLWRLHPDLRKIGRYYLLGRTPRPGAYLKACREVWWGKALAALDKQQPSQKKRAQLEKLWGQDRDFRAFAERRAKLAD